MKDIVLIGRTILKYPHITQHALAEKLQFSLNYVDNYLSKMEESGFISSDHSSNYFLTAKGMDFMRNYKVDNAIITAAGFGSRFVPLSYDIPKGLIEVFGEPMIERQIKQLHEAGITDITIVVGYLKEKFEYLIDKYGVKLVFNPEYASKNSLSSLYCVRHLLKNTYILASDHWLRDNIYNEYEPFSWYSGSYIEGKTSEWCLVTDNTLRVTDVLIGGTDSYVMYGPVYFNREFSSKYRHYAEEYYNTPGTENFYWEQILKDRVQDLVFYCNRRPDNTVYEFENLEELRLFDTKYLTCSGNAALEHISQVFNVSESAITNIKYINNDNTRKSFLFDIKDETYIFHMPSSITKISK